MADPRLCAVTGCINPKHTKYFCSTHAWRFKHHGSTDKPPSKRKLLPERCSALGCSAAPERGRKGMCARHYRMLYRRGTTVGKLPPRGEAAEWLQRQATYTGDECLIWPYARGRCGDARMGKKFSVAGKLTAQAARAMCALAHGDPPSSDYQAAHCCGKGHHGCVNPRHLEWKSPLANTWDKDRHGTMLRGEQHPSAKLSALQVQAIRTLSPHFTVPELFDLFGTSPRTICDIIDGKAWQCLA